MAQVEFGERVDAEGGVGEVVGDGGGVGHGDDAEAGGSGGLVTRNGVFEGDGLVGREAEFFEGEEVEVGGGLAVDDVFAADHGVEAGEQVAGFEVAFHMGVGGVGGHGEAEAGVVGLVEEGDHTGANGRFLAALAGDGLEAGVELGAVVVRGVGAPDVVFDADVADEGVEDGAIGGHSVGGVNIFPGGDDGAFGVHEKAVKVENESAQRHGGARKAGRRGMQARGGF